MEEGLTLFLLKLLSERGSLVKVEKGKFVLKRGELNMEEDSKKNGLYNIYWMRNIF
ncbi:hypothetical protein [Lederbergia citrea]|uniref:hypothetical protein n=1 Tax=Lederbergia citrea TaxID=2833581 RepID=UPI001BC96A4B|nr:hypothetical protein [Lederbergia citrea]MBS4203438.1 hypothetical protein [Lederbergia citrea]